MQPSLEAIDHFIKTTAVYGIAGAFLVFFLLIVLRVIWKVTDHGINLLGCAREWLPKWFHSQISTNEAVCKNLDSLTERMVETGGAVNKTHKCVTGLAFAAAQHAEERPDEFSEGVRRQLEHTAQKAVA